MSWIEDEGYDGWDFPFEDSEWEKCDDCGDYFPTYQEFCYNCLSIENKWKLGVL